MNQYRLAIVGLGKVSEYQKKALDIDNINQLNLVAVCDTNPMKKDKYPDLPFFTKMKDLIFHIKPDVIIISVPNSIHYKVAKEALEEGVHVIVEKPPTTSLSEFDKLCNIADKTKALFYSSYHFIFSQELQWYLKDFLPDNREILGPVTGFYSEFYDPYINQGQPQINLKSLEGSWSDSGINALSIIMQIIPDLSIKYSKLFKEDKFNCDEIKSTVSFSFGKSYSGEIITDWTKGFKQKTTKLFYSHNNIRIILDHNKQMFIYKKKGKKDIYRDIGNKMQRQIARYLGVFKDFIVHLENKKDNRIFSRRCLELLLKAKQLSE